MPGSNPTVNVTGSRHGDTIIGAVSHDSDSFYTWSEETITTAHGIALLRALIDETVVERVVGDSFQVWYFPPHAPELHPVEGYWDQLESWFNYRLVRKLDQLKTQLKTTFTTITPPTISNIFVRNYIWDG